MSYHIQEPKVPVHNATRGIENLSLNANGMPKRSTTAGVGKAESHAEFVGRMRQLVGLPETEHEAVGSVDSSSKFVTRTPLAGIKNTGRELGIAMLQGVRQVPRQKTAGIAPVRQRPQGIVSLKPERTGVAGLEVPRLPVRRVAPAGVVSLSGADNVPREEALEHENTAGAEEECEAQLLAKQEITNGAFEDEEGNFVLPHSEIKLLAGSEAQERFNRHLVSGCGACTACLSKVA